jgi:hypothetical protein
MRPWLRELDRGDQFARAKHGVEFGLVTRQRMQFRRRDAPSTISSGRHIGGIERRECHRRIGRLGRNTGLAPSKNSMLVIDPV